MQQKSNFQIFPVFQGRLKVIEILIYGTARAALQNDINNSPLSSIASALLTAAKAQRPHL